MRSGQPFEEWRREAIHKLEGRWLGRTQGELWDELPPAEKAKRQSAQILRREKQEAKRQQEALANLERAAQKERRQEVKVRAQEEALAQRLVERSQKEREEEARHLEETSNERELLRKQMLSESQERLQAKSRELEEAARRDDAQAKARIEAAERLNKFLNKQRQKPNPSEPKIMNATHEPQAGGPASLDPYGRFPNDPTSMTIATLR